MDGTGILAWQTGPPTHKQWEKRRGATVSPGNAKETTGMKHATANSTVELAVNIQNELRRIFRRNRGKTAEATGFSAALSRQRIRWKRHAESKARRWSAPICRMLFLALCAPPLPGLAETAEVELFRRKAGLLEAAVFDENFTSRLGDAPAGAAGHGVFFSVCDGSSRASVFKKTGATLESAWSGAVEETSSRLAETGLNPLWVKADVVVATRPSTPADLGRRLAAANEGSSFFGVAFDASFDQALLGMELNGVGIYDYDEGTLNMKRLKRYLKASGAPPMNSLPAELTLFDTAGWFCDGEETVHPLIRRGEDCGRRVVSPVTGEYAAWMIRNAAEYLCRQVHEDGSFTYGIYPRTEKNLSSYNILRHCGTVWSLLCRFRMAPDEALAERIGRAIDYLVSQVVRDGSGAAYLLEAKDNTIKLGGCGIAILALTECMEVFGTREHEALCRELGEGILKLQNPETGGYWHVLNADFTPLEEMRTVYYDGEATFGLIRLYGLTGERKWLDAAVRAVEHFIAGHYEQYRDHWVAYSLDEITKYVDDRPDFYAFALLNAEDNLKRIADRSRTYPVNLELLLASFETHERMVERGVDTGNFDLQAVLDSISERVDRQLSGFFFPEYAMYMACPQRILHSFMMRDVSWRVRIDDVQHNIGGFYLYWKNYDRLVARGLRPRGASVEGMPDNYQRRGR